jgi:hypothetical protein
LQGVPREVIERIHPKALTTLGVECFFSVMREDNPNPSALQFEIKRASKINEDCKRSHGEVLWSYFTGPHNVRSHYYPGESGKSPPTLFPLAKKRISGPEHKVKMKVLYDLAARMKPLRQMRPTDRGKDKQGALPRVAYAPFQSAGSNGGQSFLDNLTAYQQHRRRTVSRGVYTLCRQIIVRRYDIVAVKAASGSGTSYFLGQILDDVVMLRSKRARGGGKAAAGRLTPDKVRVCYYKEAKTYDEEAVSSDKGSAGGGGSGGEGGVYDNTCADSDDGGVTFVFQQTDHVPPEAIHDWQVKYYNPVLGGLNLSLDKVIISAKASPASIMREFTISDKESERLHDAVSGTAGKATFREQCQKAFGVVSIGDEECEDDGDDDDDDDVDEDNEHGVAGQYKVGTGISSRGRKRDINNFKRMAQGKTTEKQKTTCEVCHTNSRKTHIIYCDGCEKEYHLHCLDPVLKDVPVGDWFGPCCAQTVRRKLR